jgi:aldehyde dehydrogenase (NAD+)
MRETALIDWANAVDFCNRKLSEAMIDFDPNTVEFERGHYIGGKFVADGSDAIPVVRPSDGRVYADLPIADSDIVDRAVKHAKQAFRDSGWSTQPPRKRAEVLRRWADLIEQEAVPLSQIEAMGSTRPISQMLNGDIPHLAESIRFFAELADKHGGSVAATQEGRFGFTITEPYGVIGAILPWNYPLGVAGWKLGPALAAGNAVVLKPSEMTPFSVLRLAALGSKAGIPSGVLNIVQGTGETTGKYIVRHRDVSKITFTGSTRAGIDIMSESAVHGLKPVTLELGGKSPQLVFADCDLDLAAGCIARSILSNAGQECVAGSRVIAHRQIKDLLIEKLAALMLDIKPGATWSGTTQYPPIISSRQLKSIGLIVSAAIDDGAEAVIGGAAHPHPSEAFFAPTILDGVRSGNPAVLREIFGPVLTVQTFVDEDEGVVLANDSEMGLAAGLYTRDLSRAVRVMKKLEAGTVWINRYGRTDDFVIPTGGYKQSGFGKDLGREAFEGSIKIKSALIDVL